MAATGQVVENQIKGKESGCWLEMPVVGLRVLWKVAGQAVEGTIDDVENPAVGVGGCYSTRRVLCVGDLRSSLRSSL